MKVNSCSHLLWCRAGRMSRLVMVYSDNYLTAAFFNTQIKKDFYLLTSQFCPKYLVLINHTPPTCISAQKTLKLCNPVLLYTPYTATSAATLNNFLTWVVYSWLSSTARNNYWQCRKRYGSRSRKSLWRRTIRDYIAKPYSGTSESPAVFDAGDLHDNHSCSCG